FFFSSRRRHTRSKRDWSSDVCSSDLGRIDRDLSRAGRQGAEEDQLPLERAIGFIDIVSYTTRSADLTPSGLASLVQDFESAARAVVPRSGGPVAKPSGAAGRSVPAA